MNATALLLMLALGIDHSGRLVSAREGGGPTEAASQDAQATGSGGAVSETVAPGPVSQPSSGSVAAPPTETATEPSKTTAVCTCGGDSGKAACTCSRCYCSGIVARAFTADEYIRGEFISPSILKFQADWCGPCQSTEIADWVLKSGWTVEYIDVDKRPEVMRAFRVTHIPTYVVIRNSREVGRYTGMSSNEFLPVLKKAVLQ